MLYWNVIRAWRWSVSDRNLSPTFVSKEILYFEGILSFTVKWHKTGCPLFKKFGLMISSDEPKVSDQINTLSFSSLQYFRFVSLHNLFIYFFLSCSHFPPVNLLMLPLHYPPHEVCQQSPCNASTYNIIITLIVTLWLELIHSLSD
jgi:hypothetical protein